MRNNPSGFVPRKCEYDAHKKTRHAGDCVATQTGHDKGWDGAAGRNRVCRPADDAIDMATGRTAWLPGLATQRARPSRPSAARSST